MITLLVVIGTIAGGMLVALLVANVRFRSFRFWPPPAGGWQSPCFWTLFRVLNVCALALGWADWQPSAFDEPLRVIAAGFGLSCAAAYVGACIHLGIANLYGKEDGLVTNGIYGWSRNPQYAIAMPAYVSLAIAAQSALLGVLVTVLIAVFMLMAISEEPWLEQAYGPAYLDYKSRVARFYNVHRVVSRADTSEPRRRSGFKVRPR